jgi:glycosyltransferase involved in cell wall biosynthesis
MSSRAPRILFISHSAHRTGAPIGLLAFQRWLRAQTDYEVGTLLRGEGPLVEAFAALGPCTVLGNSFLGGTRVGRRIRNLLPRTMRDETGRICRAFRAGSYDAIYSNTITNGAVLAALARFGVPVLTHVHELGYWISRAGPENLRQVLAHTAHYVAASSAVRDHLVRERGIPRERISVVYEHIRELPPIPEPAARTAARAALGIPTSAFVVGGCGAEHWRKGRDLIPQLLVNLRRQAPGREFRFVWVGRPGSTDDESNLLQDLRTAGIESCFHSIGEVANPFAFYPAFDVFALLSRDDPYPLACLEVAALETPIVCFDRAGGIPEFVGADSGCVSPYLDLEQFASLVLKLAENPNWARACASNARMKVARESLPEVTGPLLLAAIEKTLTLV